jgi:acyl-CoA synthetase (AMP-forming)/AMP-acid ligase II
MALLHFTSGTTGTPKGAMHVHGAVVTHFATGRYALDLHPTTSSGAPPTRAGSPAPRTASSRRCCTA